MNQVAHEMGTADAESVGVMLACGILSRRGDCPRSTMLARLPAKRIHNAGVLMRECGHAEVTAIFIRAHAQPDVTRRRLAQ